MPAAPRRRTWARRWETGPHSGKRSVTAGARASATPRVAVRKRANPGGGGLAALRPGSLGPGEQGRNDF